ncbi:hypothetical protein [Streptomyces sp. SID13031]|uniref:hypothetical protein n=1 Tax=Streptomyces sp. SID13031 TaxID=2706046 RepID=UPI0013CBA415|nr:hypothetical protein [Streptomyces sp. SID13031]NEA37180.1 hypothetical protein [Streptomyces sp. SID13031]
MRIDPLTIKPWLAGLAAGLFFGVFFAAISVITFRDELDSWLWMIIPGLVAAVGVALAAGLGLLSTQRRLRPAVEGLSPEAARVALKAARRGPVPTQPEIRAAALGIAERQLAGFLRVRIWLLIAGACAIVSQVFLALDDDGFDWWRLLAAAAFALAFAMQFYQPKLTRRRIAQLRG